MLPHRTKTFAGIGVRRSRPGVSAGLLFLAVVATAGCRRTSDSRSTLDLEQALHGHWCCTAEIPLAPDTDDWNVVGRPEQSIIEADRYVDSRTQEKTWVEAGADLRWRTVSQTPETGEIVVVTWSPANPDATRKRVLRIDRARTVCLELLSSKGLERTVQRWTYVNGQSSP